MLPGHLERLCEHVSLLRVPGAYGDPWEWAGVVFHPHGMEDVTIEGVERAPKLQEHRWAVQVLKDAGVKTAHYVRIKSGEVVHHTIKG